MKNQHIRGSQFQFLLVENVEIFHPYIILFIEETLLLNTGHVQDIKSWKCVLETFLLDELDIVALQYILTDIAWDTKLFRRDQDKFYVLITHQCLDQRMDSTSEFQITAETDRDIVKSAFEGTDS